MTINLARLPDYPIIDLDVETTGTDWQRDKVFGIALAVWDGERVMSEYYDIRENENVVPWLAKVVPQCKKVVNHHLKFDSHFLWELGIRVPLDRIDCTQVRAALINEWEESHGRSGYDLDALCRKYIGEGKPEGIYEELAEMFGGAPKRSVQMKNLHRAPARLAGKYAAPDPALALKLYLWQEEEIKRQKLERICDLERRLLPILIKAERRGVRVDEELAASRSKDMDRVIAEAQRSLDKIAGRSVNANSPPQLRELFGVRKDADDKWETSAGHKLMSTDAGNPSIDKDALILMAGLGDERAQAIMTLRKMIKAKQFLDDHILGHAVKGRVHCNFNQTRGENELGTGTGRLSIDDPALQQIPARDKDIAAIVRACFLPEKGHEWLCADWEQFEFRWFAHYTKDANILEAYRKDPKTDYHSVVAAITGIPRNPRYAGDANAKQINLGLVFGMGQGKLAQEMGLDYTVVSDKNKREWLRAGPKAIEVFDKYHAAIPGVRKLLEQASSIARSRGYVETLGGRHIRFPGGRATYKAGGLVFQGTSADCMKQKMIELDPICEQEGAPYLLTVHDEHDISVPKTKSKKVPPRIKELLETFDGEKSPIMCRVPILSSVAVGPNWWEASK